MRATGPRGIFPETSGGIAMIFTDWTWFMCYILCRILMRCVSSYHFHSNMVDVSEWCTDHICRIHANTRDLDINC